MFHLCRTNILFIFLLFFSTYSDLLTMERDGPCTVHSEDVGRLARWRLEAQGLGDERGQKLLTAAVQAVDFESMACLGVLNNDGDLVDQAAEYGFVPAIYEQGMRAIDYGQREEGLRLLTVAAYYCHLPALYHKARILFFANEVEQASECLRQLFVCDNDFLPALHMIGLLGVQGKLDGDSEQNEVSGAWMLQRVARRGYAPACYDLAMHYPSAGRREQWLQQALAAGYVPALREWGKQKPETEDKHAGVTRAFTDMGMLYAPLFSLHRSESCFDDSRERTDYKFADLIRSVRTAGAYDEPAILRNLLAGLEAPDCQTPLADFAFAGLQVLMKDGSAQIREQAEEQLACLVRGENPVASWHKLQKFMSLLGENPADVQDLRERKTALRELRPLLNVVVESGYKKRETQKLLAQYNYAYGCLLRSQEKYERAGRYLLHAADAGHRGAKIARAELLIDGKVCVRGRCNWLLQQEIIGLLRDAGEIVSEDVEGVQYITVTSILDLDPDAYDDVCYARLMLAQLYGGIITCAGKRMNLPAIARCCIADLVRAGDAQAVEIDQHIPGRV